MVIPTLAHYTDVNGCYRNVNVTILSSWIPKQVYDISLTKGAILEAILLDTAKSVLGQTTGKGAYNEKEVWWWNEDVQKAVKEKRLKFKKYQEYRCDEDKEVFREANKKAKREVAKAKESACKDLYDKLDSIEGQKII